MINMDGTSAEVNPLPTHDTDSSVSQRRPDKDTDIDIVDLEKIPPMKMWGRPYTRPDGSVLTIEVEPEEQHIEVSIDYTKFNYGRDDVLLLGDGNFESGVVKIGRAAFNDPRTSVDAWGKERVLQEEIEKLKTAK